MLVTFFGVRGSIATSGVEFAEFGGNTTCLAVEHEGHRLIVDAGTGLRALGDRLLTESRTLGRPVSVDLLFTHLHWDHIQGFPFFAPAFVPSTTLALYGPKSEQATLEEALAAQMRPPHFPVPLQAMGAKKRFQTLGPNEQLDIGPFRVTTAELMHPQGVLGYRFEADGRSVCFATDTEHHEDGSFDEGLLRIARGADLLIYDAQYTPAEYEGRVGPSRKGWGHSTYAVAAKLAKAADAKKLILFHHDPTHDDAMVRAIESEARGLFPWASAARERLPVAA
ncbi:MAG: MBL fold metallo-hydrolase [Deltaproteobacteria bacterium]|nr:MBL fold metallo-hydrolase [Deltaproteobacteria bacterium]